MLCVKDAKPSFGPSGCFTMTLRAHENSRCGQDMLDHFGLSQVGEPGDPG